MPSRDEWYRSDTGGWLRHAPPSAQATPNAPPASSQSPLSKAPTAPSPTPVSAPSKPFDWSASSTSIFTSKPFATVSPPGVQPTAPNATGSTASAVQTPRWSAGDASALRKPVEGSPPASVSEGLSGSPFFTDPNSTTARPFVPTVPASEPPPMFVKFAVDANGREVRSQEDVALAYYEKKNAEQAAILEKARVALAREAFKKNGFLIDRAGNTVLPPVVSPAEEYSQEGEDTNDKPADAKEDVAEEKTEEKEYEEDEEEEDEEEDRVRAEPLPLASLMLSMSSETRIATTSTGPIYSATMDEEATPVAVKIVKSVLSGTDTDRFLEELQTLQNLPPNRHVLKHYGYVRLNSGKQFGVVTQLVHDAKSLQNYLYRSRSFDGQPVIVKYRFISWLLEGLVHLHSNGIAHGDLTPNSVLVTRSGSDFLPTLTNFGLPTLKTTSVLPHAKAGALGFNPAYASPELLRGEIGYDDVEAWKKSDVYSATVLIVELLLEQPPWEGELPVYFMKAVRKRGERPFDLDDVKVYGHKAWWLKEILAGAWHQDASKRPTVDDLKQWLSSALDCSKVSKLARTNGSTQ